VLCTLAHLEKKKSSDHDGDYQRNVSDLKNCLESSLSVPYMTHTCAHTHTHKPCWKSVLPHFRMSNASPEKIIPFSCQTYEIQAVQPHTTTPLQQQCNMYHVPRSQWRRNRGSMNCSFQNPTVKTALKSVDFDKDGDKNKLALFYGPRCS